jgi:class 3 adenylate cyclase
MAVSDQLATAVRNESATDAEALLSRLAAGGSRMLRGRGEPISVWTL